MSIKKIVQRILFLHPGDLGCLDDHLLCPAAFPEKPHSRTLQPTGHDGGFSPTDLEAIIASYNAKFGLDKPLYQQYFDYVSGIATA